MERAWGKRTWSSGLQKIFGGKMEWCHCGPFHFAPQYHFALNIPCSVLSPRLYLEKTHFVNHNIALCWIKWCENVNKRYMIMFNHMQRLYCGICQNNWCQNASKLIYQTGKFRFCEIFKTWFFLASLISMCDAELNDDRNQVDVKINPRQACFFFSKHPLFHFAPMFHLAPTYYISRESYII